ncbi:MAG TPA: hypothetical protein PLP29_12865 [Candidatus Ozemobacteraceae bacterium]|nr:hypothetical protein [Candidatus Ozemobacteraceae bacterium]
MAIPLKYRFDFGLALGLIVFCWVTAKAQLQIEDGPLISIYGYPFYWHWWDPAVFKTRIINPLALFANFTVIVGIIGVAGNLVALWGRYVWLMIVIRIVLWLCAIYSILHLGSFFYNQPLEIAWQLPVGKIFNEVWYIGHSYPF